MIRSLIEWVLSTVPGIIVSIYWNQDVGVPLAIAGLLLVSLYELLRKHHRYTRLKGFQTDLVNYFRAAVGDMISPKTPIRELTLTYIVGLTARSDAQRREYKIEVPSDGEAVVGKELLFGVSGANVPSALAYDSLRMAAELEDASKQVLPIPIQQSPGSVRVCIWFRPQVEPGQMRKLSIRARQRGAWNDLRAKGHDNDCSYTLTDCVQTLRIAIIPPPGLPSESLRLIPDPNLGGTVDQYLDPVTKREGCVWTLENPTDARPLTYDVVCEPLGRFPRRLWLLIARPVRRVTSFLRS